MKYRKSIIVLILGLCTTTFVWSQPKFKERLKAQKVAFITEQLTLTTEESQKFWPIYNKHEEELKALRKKHKTAEGRKAIDKMTDKEIEALIEKRLESEEQKIKLQRQYIRKLKGAIPIRKIAKLMKVERLWKRQLVQRMKKRREKRMNKQ